MVVRIVPYKVLAYGLSDIGLLRQNNEDFWRLLPEVNLYVLADGMGGHRAGEVASQVAVESLCEIFQKLYEARTEDFTFEDAQDLVRVAIEQTNGIVYKLGRSSKDLWGLGTTLCCLYFHPQGVIYAHVGDSRIYLLRQQKLMQITSDHSLFRHLVKIGKLEEEQSTDFMYKNVITKAIGAELFVEPTIRKTEVHLNDIFLMCSDGLSDLLTEEEIRETLIKPIDLKEMSHELVANALAKGGHDNVTVVITKIQESHDAPDIPRQ